MGNVDSRPFPQDLLQRSKSEVLNYFDEKVFVPHRNIKDALEQLLDCVLEPAGTSIYLVFGCTGSGKSTLRRQFENKLIGHFMQDMIDDPGRIPVAGFEIPTQTGKFDYGDYYTRALEALLEVLIESKIQYPSLDFEDDSQRIISHSVKTNAKRRALEKALKNRKLAAFNLDEAQQLLMVAGAAKMLNQFDWIKSMANISKTTHVLFGTYELLNCRTWNGQTGRRSEDIHLARYHATDKNDYAEFAKTIKTLQKFLPLQQEPDLSKHYDYLIEYSLGCVGILKNWLLRSLRIALKADEHTLLLSHLKKGELPKVRLKQIREEAERGEQILKEEASPNINTQGSFSSANDSGTRNKNQNRSKPGMRNPKRDTVGSPQE
ncbi:AAA family ATPase [Leptolyngbya sp. AN03gr2]|uniref:ATP-binding protein n=1 Tax=unclassified Leptolyngbya TaxID=2650499 RepID=UPI003D312130